MEKTNYDIDFITSTVAELDGVDDSKILADNTTELPSRNDVADIIKDLQALLFPRFFEKSDGSENTISQTGLLLNIYNRLARQINGAFAFNGTKCHTCAEELSRKFVERLPAVKEMLVKDVEALYEGDPAAKSRAEVLLSYPGFRAIFIYRVSHELYLLEIPLLARMMTEYAHEKTGVDIHAGATIGEYFFIDHGTGIVIGETTTIGNHVKLYQGVTLGAKSFELDENGNPVKEIKRHPDIGNNVVIYANATILGGDTKIGDNCVIGGNTWLIHSVEENTVVKK